MSFFQGLLTGGNTVHVSAFGGFPAADGVTNRIAIQAGIDYISTRNKILLFDPATYNVTLNSSGKGIEFKSNTNMRPKGVGNTTLNFIPPANFKTSNFPGGTVAADQVRAITIDNSVAPVDNISLTNFTITTPLVKWYDASNYLQTVPVAFYMSNTGVENDYNNPAVTAANNYTFTDVHVENFQRGSITVRGRKINNVSFLSSSFTNMNRAETEYPGENDYVYKEIIVEGLAPSATSHDFAIADGFSYLVALFNGSTLLYSIPYPGNATNDAIGGIVGNPITAGLLQWTLGAGIEAQLTSITVIAYRRYLGGTGATPLNGVAFDFANINGLTINDCDFTGCSDNGGHYVYLTRFTDNITITNNRFTGLGIRHVNNGGGIHIRGAAYNNIVISGNTFTNTHDNTHLSSVTNAEVFGNTHLWNYDLPPSGNNFEITYSALDGLSYHDNTSNSLNTFLPHAWIIAYSPELISNVHIYDNEVTNTNVINCLGVSVVVEDNTLIATPYTTSNDSLIVLIHDDIAFEMGVVFQNNTITFNSFNPQPVIEGFSGFTWRNNTINSVNLFRFGNSLKLNNLIVEDCTINLAQFYSDSMVVDNVSLINTYTSSAAYTAMVQNSAVEYSNITDTGVQPRGVAEGAINIIKTGAVNVTIAAPGNLEYFFFRSFDNVNLPYQVTLTNTSAHTITVIDHLNSVAALKNFDNGGVNYSWLAGTQMTVQLDKVNARWVKV